MFVTLLGISMLARLVLINALVAIPNVPSLTMMLVSAAIVPL